MAQSRFQWLAQMFAALGVIISLLLLAYEMKQARDLAEADLYIQRANMAAYHISLGFEHDSRDEFEKMMEG